MANSQLTLYTEDHVIQGELNAGGRRISDLLNASTSNFLEVENARWQALHSLEEVPSASAQITLRKEAIQLVVPRDGSLMNAARKQTQQLVFELVMPGFKLTGSVHRRSGDPASTVQLLGGITRQFLAISDAKLSYLANAVLDQDVPMLLLNTAHLRFWSVPKVTPRTPA